MLQFKNKPNQTLDFDTFKVIKATYQNPSLTMWDGPQTMYAHLAALSQLMRICNKKSWNGVYKINTFSLSCRQDNTATANINTNKQSCPRIQTQQRYPQTHTDTD